MEMITCGRYCDSDLLRYGYLNYKKYYVKKIRKR